MIKVWFINRNGRIHDRCVKPEKVHHCIGLLERHYGWLGYNLRTTDYEARVILHDFNWTYNPFTQENYNG